jgi:ArsR family transcriptional regulator
MDYRQEGTLTYALLTSPARVQVCRALLEAGDAGIPAATLAAALGLTMPRAAHLFKELMQADIVMVSVRDRHVIYSLKARREVREALGYLDSSGLLT